VITSDSGIAHLAGALGRPVWLLLARTPEWRWGLTGERTAWYPTMRIFRQNSTGDWKSVVEAVKAALSGESGASDSDPNQ
jgi:ADP-heptose:LPS heptosyltransferase